MIVLIAVNDISSLTLDHSNSSEFSKFLIQEVYRTFANPNFYYFPYECTKTYSDNIYAFLTKNLPDAITPEFW